MGLKIEKVSKYYGEKLAVDNISFEMNEPGVFGLLGTNGAGKTTTIRMILGIIKKDAGEITWNGQKVERKNVNFGYLPEERGVYPKTKIIEQLMYFAELKGMKKQEAAKEIDYWLKSHIKTKSPSRVNRISCTTVSNFRIPHFNVIPHSKITSLHINAKILHLPSLHQFFIKLITKFHILQTEKTSISVPPCTIQRIITILIGV